MIHSGVYAFSLNEELHGCEGDKMKLLLPSTYNSLKSLQ